MENANENCVGPSSTDAGKNPNCEGCPNQSACSSGKFSSPQAQEAKNKDHRNIGNALSRIQHVILIMSGKGGVGKSTVCCQLAHTLSIRGCSVGVLDVDICGPSVARMLGCSGGKIHESASGILPVYVNPNLSVMSISFMVDEDVAVIWRGPRKNALIQKFLTDTEWDEEGIDYLLIDTPPGTSDEHISTVQYLQGGLQVRRDENMEPNKGGSLGSSGLSAIMVTTPEEISLMDVRKELNFAKKTDLPVLGVIENMARYQTRVRDLSFLQRKKGGDKISTAEEKEKEEEEDITQDVLNLLETKCPEVLDIMAVANIFPSTGDGPRGMAQRYNVPYLGTIPLDPNLLLACDQGRPFVQIFPNSPAVPSLNSIVDQIEKILPVYYDEEHEDDREE